MRNPARYAVWLLLAAPAAIQSFRYWQGGLFYGEYLHWSGVFATQLLVGTLAVTPLRRAFPHWRWLRTLAAWRRYLGVATFGYAALHTIAYLARQDGFDRIIADAASFEIGSGWIALAVFAALAATSNDRSLRTLGRSWKTLHRAVYAAALLTFAHWILTAFDPTEGIAYLGVFVLLECLRIYLSWRTSPQRDGAGMGREMR